MRFVKTLTVVMASLLIGSFAVVADEAKEEAKQDAPKELKNQTHCPVMGGSIDSTVYTDIQGQRVYHCCPMCSKQLKEDPDKFFKKAAADGILFENIQTTCPVSGKELEDKSVFIDHEGRRVAFCCKKCRGAFTEDTKKFLSKLDAPADKMEGDDMKGHEEDDMKKGHEGHNH